MTPAIRSFLHAVTLAAMTQSCRPAPVETGTVPAPVEFHAGNPALPFSEAVRVGSMLYLSGQIGTDSTLRLVPGGVVPETRQTLENIRAVLERHGSSLDRVVKCTVMLADISEWSTVNSVYVTFFPGRKPARSALGANGLALGARVEIECWATVG
jgi:reactive intermediate/imine deaminase